MSEENPRNRRLIVGVVIALGVLIVIAFAIIIGTIIYRLSHKTEAASAVAPPSGLASDGSEFGNVHITIPAGYRVTDTDIDNGRLLVRLDPVTGDGAVRLLLFDLETGARVGAFTLEAAPPP